MFTVTQVGSWPRSRELLRALRANQTGKISRAEFERVADDEVRRCVHYQLEAGVDIIVDGEQRRDNFYSFITDKLAGTQLMSLAEMLDTVEDKSSFEEIMWVGDFSGRAYGDKTEMADDVVRVLREELLELRDAGADFVQFDEPVLTEIVMSEESSRRTFM
jgi:5-methyltetrahydropteroyltriglutamate--homocysteine methyltransferase